MAEPFSHDAALAAQATQTEQQRRQRILDYKGTFAGDRGRRVFEDLCRLFGFEQPSGGMGMSHGDVMLREGMKMPLWYIKRMRDMPLQGPRNARRRAISAGAGPDMPSTPESPPA